MPLMNGHTTLVVQYRANEHIFSDNLDIVDQAGKRKHD